MPTYVYHCQQCGHEFEVFQAITDDPVQTCPQCGGPVHRVITGGSGLIFKGSGFYITDYSRNRNSSSSSSSKKEEKPAKEQKSKDQTSNS